MPYNYDMPDYASAFSGMQNQPQGQSQGFDFGKLFSDPNVLRAMGELGAMIGGKGSVGESLGSTGSMLTRRRAQQAAAAKQAQKQQTFQEQLIKALSQGRLLTNAEDNTMPDKVQLSSDGGTLSWKNTPPKVGYAGEQVPLEAYGNQGAGLPDFFKASLA